MNRWPSVSAMLLSAACTFASAETVCRFTTAGTLSFGPYDVLSPVPRDSQTDIQVICERNGGPANVSVMVGLGPSSRSGSTTARLMSSPGSATTLAYGLYRDSGRTLVWGNTAGSDTASQTASIPNRDSATLTFTVYARIPAQQPVLAGSYGDAVQVTVTP